MWLPNQVSLHVVWQRLWIQTTASEPKVFQVAMPPNDPPKKKAKFGSQAVDRFTFTNAHDIKKALQTTQNSDLLSKGLCVVFRPWSSLLATRTALSALRSKLSSKPDEIVTPHDDRLSLAKLWMESSLAAQDLFDIWEIVNDVCPFPVWFRKLSTS